MNVFWLYIAISYFGLVNGTDNFGLRVLVSGGHGMIPVPFMGTVDQHSQLQLHLDGPSGQVVFHINARLQRYRNVCLKRFW